MTDAPTDHEALSSLLFFAPVSSEAFEDAGIAVKVDPSKFAVTVACKLDSKGVRKALGRVTEKGCDGAFFGFFPNGKPPNVLAVELKGANIAHAVEQLAVSVGRLKTVLGPRWERRISAVVVSDAASPTDFNGTQKAFRARCEAKLFWRPAQRGGAPTDLTAALLGSQ